MLSTSSSAFVLSLCEIVLHIECSLQLPPLSDQFAKLLYMLSVLLDDNDFFVGKLLLAALFVLFCTSSSEKKLD